jgi:NlpC/P60 family putative phage cell wall peptidase
VTRADVVRLARTWIGTPYHHQAACRGAGADCIGLVRGVWRELYGAEPEAAPGYSADWAEASGIETLIEAARRHMTEIPPREARTGDVAIFRYRPGLPAKHTGILGNPAASHPAGSHTLIHALEGASVTEIPLSPWWRRRMAAAFAFPGIAD